MDPEAERLARQTRAIAAIPLVIGILLSMCAGLLGPGVIVAAPFLLLWLQADARVRRHPLPTGAAYTMALVPAVGLPVYLWQTRGRRGAAIGLLLFAGWIACPGALLLFG